MDHDQLFDLHCKGEFDTVKVELAELRKSQAQVLAALKGGPDKPGLCERVRTLEHVYRKIWTGVALIVGTVVVQAIVQIVAWLGRRISG
ncbi:MAG TPA: hypothetical protein VM238_22925 [Phycisphaerae bacterium]|nr:hypothetical protein [Phycisphaerae bacterium]